METAPVEQAPSNPVNSRLSLELGADPQQEQVPVIILTGWFESRVE